MIVRVDRHPKGPRLYVAGCRVHHGTAGLVCAALALTMHRSRIAVAAAAFGATDWRDFPFRDCDNH